MFEYMIDLMESHDFGWLAPKVLLCIMEEGEGKTTA